MLKPLGFAIVLALGAMVAIIALLGARLPVGHVASRSAVIGAPVDVVFNTITDFNSAPSWRTNLKSVTVTTESTTGRQRVTEESSTGAMTMEVEQLIPPGRTRSNRRETPHASRSPSTERSTIRSSASSRSTSWDTRPRSTRTSRTLGAGSAPK